MLGVGSTAYMVWSMRWVLDRGNMPEFVFRSDASTLLVVVPSDCVHSQFYVLDEISSARHTPVFM